MENNLMLGGVAQVRTRVDHQDDIEVLEISSKW
jgi:hypothetical protein